MKFVQFKDDTETVVTASFASEQDNEQFPNQGTIADDDQRFIDFINKFSGVAIEAKRRRSALLVGSDWTVLPDSPLSVAKQDEWKIYRQELRDIPEQSGYPDIIEWPVQPL